MWPIVGEAYPPSIFLGNPLDSKSIPSLQLKKKKENRYAFIP